MFKGNISKFDYYLILYFICIYWKTKFTLRKFFFTKSYNKFLKEIKTFIETHTIVAYRYIVLQNLTLTLAFDLFITLKNSSKILRVISLFRGSWYLKQCPTYLMYFCINKESKNYQM